MLANVLIGYSIFITVCCCLVAFEMIAVNAKLRGMVTDRAQLQLVYRVTARYMMCGAASLPLILFVVVHGRFMNFAYLSPRETGLVSLLPLAPMLVSIVLVRARLKRLKAVAELERPLGWVQTQMTEFRPYLKMATTRGRDELIGALSVAPVPHAVGQLSKADEMGNSKQR